MTVQYTNDFSLGPGVPALDFVVSEAGGTGGGAVCDGLGKWKFSTGTTAGHTLRGILPSAKWLSADGRATIYWTTGTTAGNIVPQIQLRTSGNWDTEIDSPVTGYKCLFLAGNGVGMFRRTGGVTTQLGAFVAKTIAANTTYGFTFEVSGSGGTAVQRVRMFTGASDPGGAWDLTTNDTVVTGPGQFQVAMLNQDAAIREVNWDDLSLDNLVTAATGPRPRLMRV